MRLIAAFIFYKLLGWKIDGDLSPHIKKAVVIVVPHTSWHDFYIGALARKLLNIQINFIAKRELFKWPFAWYFKWMGGAPVDRKSNMNTVQQITALFNSKDEFRLAIAPEGTRKKVSEWRSGFYYIAVEAKVPIICVAFNYKTKIVEISTAFTPTGDYDKDLPELKFFYKDVVGKIAAYT